MLTSKQMLKSKPTSEAIMKYLERISRNIEMAITTGNFKRAESLNVLYVNIDSILH